MDSIKKSKRVFRSSGTMEPRVKRPFRLGDPLEYRVSRLLINMGFFVRRGREIYTVARLDTATDLDVLGIRYAEPFRREVQIVECKGGAEGPMDRTFWLAGVKQYVSADRATLVRQGTKWNIKNFAGELGIEILDLPHLEELENIANVDKSIWLGSSDRDYFAIYADEWNKAINADPVIKELFFTLAGEIRFHEPSGGISFLLHHLRSLTRNLREQRSISESLTRFLIAESVAQLAMFLMRIAEVAVLLSPSDRDGLIQKGLTYGQMDKVFVDRLFRNAKRITSEMIKHYTGREIKVDDSYFNMPEPPGVKEIQEIVKLLIARPAAATSFPALADLLVSERFLKQREGIEWLPTIFPFTDIKERLSLVQDYLKILKSLDAIPDALTGTNKKSSAKPAIDALVEAGKDGGANPASNSATKDTQAKQGSPENSSTLFE